MIVNKKIDLGEYIVKVTYNNSTGSLEVNILDELNEVIESIYITNDNENSIDPTLN